MNAVEIEVAISELAEQPFDATEFPFAFLQAFGNKETTLRRLRKGESNKSDLGGVLQTSNIHIATPAVGEVATTLAALKASSATVRAKAKFILATDGEVFEAEDLTSGETVACAYPDFPNHFGFFLPLAGITAVQQIRESSFDIRATSRLNRLYVELLKDNPAWGTEKRRPDMNHFMARLIFCFFAEDTDIFTGGQTGRLFTTTVERMSARDSSNTHEVLGKIFQALNLKGADREAAEVPRWAETFPYVNGGLFSGNLDVPRFSRIARSYLLHIGSLDWTKINPDIFGSMIQAVTEDEERGSLGMHYTSVPNILKVLNPLFLNDLRATLEDAGDSSRKLLNLRNRLTKIRVFDPACGSGNFLVIAYKEMRAIEATINKCRGEADRRSDIPLTNFRGIELRDFPAEIARLALIIAEYQCDVIYRGQKLALAEFLPLEKENWIVCGNALRLDWLSICPPTGTGVKIVSDDLFETPVNQAEIEFQNAGGETYICGNPPYVGDKKQSKPQKADMENIFSPLTSRWRSFDYVTGFFAKAARYIASEENSAVAFVATNSISQGIQVSEFWPLVLDKAKIFFGQTSFPWSNLAANNAGVICVIVGLCPSKKPVRPTILDGEIARQVDSISPYLIAGQPIYIRARPNPLSEISEMLLGNFAKDEGNLICDYSEIGPLDDIAKQYLRPMFGGQEFIRGIRRYCFWISEDDLPQASESEELKRRFELVRKARLQSPKKATAEWSAKPFRFVEVRSPAYDEAMIIPIVSSERRPYLPIGYLPRGSIVNYAFGMYDAPLWNMALVASRLHLVWIATVCGKMKNDFRYSNTLGWNTFPVPTLTEKNKADLTTCAEAILLAREAHFPATIADLYDPETMPSNLREAHEHNDEVLDRIYIGRRFRNDTERLEKLFDLYTKMTSGRTPGTKKLSAEQVRD